MRDQARWAARYQFLEELWRGRDRLLHDPALERAVSSALHAGSGRGEEVLHALLDRLLPRSHDEDVWLATDHVSRIAEFSRSRPGVHFVGIDDAASIAEEGWEVAVVNLEGVRSTDDLETLPPSLSALIEVIEEHAQDDRRVVVLMLPGPTAGGPQEDAAMQILGTVLPHARLFGVMWPTVASVITVAGLEDDAEDDFSVDVDNSLAAETLAIDTWIAVSSADFKPATLTMIELENPQGEREFDLGGRDHPHDDRQDDRHDDVAGLRAELLEARRQADLHAIEKQRLSELLDDAHMRLAESGDLAHEGGTGEHSEAGLAGVQARLEGALAREQALRWELARVQAMLEDVASRPVEELEAQNARLRAELARRGPGPADASSEDETPVAHQEDVDEDEATTTVPDHSDAELDEHDDVTPVEQRAETSAADTAALAGPSSSEADGDARTNADLRADAEDVAADGRDEADGPKGDQHDADGARAAEREVSDDDPEDAREEYPDYTRGPSQVDDEQTRWNDAPHEDEDEGGFDRLRRGLITTIDRLLRRLDN